MILEHGEQKFCIRIGLQLLKVALRNQNFQNSVITVTQQEIVSLYERFCQLNRNNCSFIPSDEFLSIPEFAVNSLSQSLLRILDGFNFKECIAFFYAFSLRATLQNNIECT